MMAQTRPAFLLVDDDFRLFSGGYGCFCPLHLAAFNQQMGTSFDRDSLMAALQKEDAESRRVGEAWTALLLESLDSLARIVRARIDDTDPHLPCGYCAPMDGAGSQVFTAPIVCTPLPRSFGCLGT